MRIIAAAEQLTDTAEVGRKSQCPCIEIHRVEEKPTQVLARRTIDLGSAVAERAPSSVETLGEVGDRAAEVAEDPLDARIARRYAGEDELRGGERRIEQKADERHEPVIRHRFHANGAGRMNVQHGSESVGLGVQGLESLVSERDAVHVAEQHRAREMQLFHRAAQLRD